MFLGLTNPIVLEPRKKQIRIEILQNVKQREEPSFAMLHHIFVFIKMLPVCLHSDQEV